MVKKSTGDRGSLARIKGGVCVNTQVKHMSLVYFCVSFHRAARGYYDFHVFALCLAYTVMDKH